MAMRGILVAVACAVVVGGCSESSIVGDASTDARDIPIVDSIPDVGPETATDTAEEAPVDTPPDFIPDLPPDGTGYCDPPTPDMDISFTIADGLWMPLRIDMPCVVTEVRRGITNRTQLSCTTEEGATESYTIDISPGWVPVGLSDEYEGHEVVFTHINTLVPWLITWFSIRDLEGGLFLAGVQAEQLIPPDFGLDDFYSPFTVDLVNTECASLEVPCGTMKRLALQLTIDDGTYAVFDHTAAALGSTDTYHVAAGEVRTFTDLDCDDVPLTWITAIFSVRP